VEEVVTRGQPVKIKVLGITGGKMSLSMKEVDQETGEDLNPGSVNKSAAGSSSREEEIAFNKNPGIKLLLLI
jgi:ATP-dependent RNA helicase DHX8/PRP22